MKDIHPKNKKDVGLRLADQALVKHYQWINKTVDGPVLEKIEKESKSRDFYLLHIKPIEILDEEIIEKENVKIAISSGSSVEWIEEESYFFRLSKWQDELLKYYEKFFITNFCLIYWYLL